MHSAKDVIVGSCSASTISGVLAVDSETCSTHRWLDQDCVVRNLRSKKASLSVAWVVECEPEGQSSGSRELQVLLGVLRVPVEEPLAAVGET